MIPGDPLGWWPGTPVDGAIAYPIPANAWTSWNADPVALLLIAVATALYVRGFVRLRRRRGVTPVTGGWQAMAFLSGIALLLVTIVSPFDRLTLALLWVHMLQYVLLTVPAALLLVLGRPIATIRWALRPSLAEHVQGWWAGSRGVRAVDQVISRPAAIGAVDIGVLVVWHAPGIQQATLGSEPLHLVQQASFLGAGLLFWWMIRHPEARPWMGHARVIVCDVAASFAGVLVGLALYGGSARPWYHEYATRAVAWGMSPRTDQQLAGAMVGVVPTFFDFIPFAYLLMRSINWSWSDA